MHRLPIVQMRGCGKPPKPAVVFFKTAVHGLGLDDIFLLRASNGTLIFSKGALTRELSLPLLLDNATVGDIIELDEGVFAKTIHKTRAIKKLRSTGVDGKPATVGAKLRFVLKEHAPVAAAGGGAAALAPLKRGRGRPRKQQPVSLDDEGEDYEEGEEDGEEEGEEDGEEGSEEDGDGDSQDDDESEEPAAKKTKSS